MSTTTIAQTTQLYQVFILATPEQIWDAITKPEFTERYFHGVRIEVRDGRRFSALGDISGTRMSWRPTRRAGSSIAGRRPTTPSLPPRSRAASPGRSSPRRTVRPS